VRQRIDRAATGERLRERVALAVSAADVASHDEPLLPMPTVSPPVRPLIEAWSPLVISEAQPLVTRLFTWRHVVRVVTSTVDGLVDVRRHQIDDALVVRHFDRQVAHIDRRRLRTQRRLVGNAPVDSNVRVAGVVVRVDIAVRIVVRVAVAVQVAVDVRVIRILGLILMLALA
jgi:hypothetical protein